MFFTKAKGWMWDKLFLDFYLDRNWTLRFKVMNIISGGELLTYLLAVRNNLDKIPGESTPELAVLRAKRAKYWMDRAWSDWRKGCGGLG